MEEFREEKVSILAVLLCDMILLAMCISTGTIQENIIVSVRKPGFENLNQV